jgi:hypothetical protein
MTFDKEDGKKKEKEKEKEREIYQNQLTVLRVTFGPSFFFKKKFGKREAHGIDCSSTI